ncbi:solute carrier family 2, facilitated glucose transporter member 5-like [Thamnophis elegans]|uniref:solute carrier family 2, facilitated glucose transporter member 5-like n=1 Tax=Thamnophis elegans TaxID=35005 RepID=UPI001377385D|nr:solute carrier family 2, facilitated glucose transporter member 5-like [Thamnophis elegans]
MDINMDEPKKSVQILAKDVKEPEVLETSPKSELTKSLIWISFASSMLSVHHGYFIWIVYSPSVLLREYYNSTSYQVITERQHRLLELAINISIVPLGAIFASVIAGFLADILGRKGVLVIANLSAITCAVLMSGKHLVNSVEFTFLTHLFTGLSAGLVLCIVPLYLGEIAPRNRRGGVVFIHQFCLNVGIMISQILTIKEFIGNIKGWTTAMGVAGILPLIQMFLIPCIPETPRYLMIHKKNERQARKVLKMLRERDDVEDEIEELNIEDLAEGNNKNMTPLKLIRTPSMRLQIITVAVVTAGSQLNGITVAYFSTERIFLMMPIDASHLKYLNNAAILIMTCSVLLGMYLVDSVGRRPLYLWTFAVCIITFILLLVSLRLQVCNLEHQAWGEVSVTSPGLDKESRFLQPVIEMPLTFLQQKIFKELSYFTSFILVLFICAHDMGPAPLPHIVTLELFSQSSRASAFVILGAVLWSISFLTGISFFYLEKALDIYSCAFFWPFCIGTLVYIYKMVPETMGQSFPDIKKSMSFKTTKRFHSRESRRRMNLKRHV